MARDYIDMSDNGALDFARNFIAGVNNQPDPIGLTTTQMTSYIALTDQYEAKLAASSATRTRGPFAIAEKEALRISLVSMSRQLAMQAQNYPLTTDPQRVVLGLTVRHPRTSIAPPTAVPSVSLDSRPGGVVAVTVNNPEQGKRARPAGCTRRHADDVCGRPAARGPGRVDVPVEHEQADDGAVVRRERGGGRVRLGDGLLLQRQGPERLRRDAAVRDAGGRRPQGRRRDGHAGDAASARRRERR